MNEQALSFGAIQNLLFLIPTGILIYWWSQKAKSDLEKRIRLLPGSLPLDTCFELPQFKISSLLVITICSLFLILALAQPRYGFESIKTRHVGADIILAVDVSESMLAEDTPPDRLTLARRKISDLTQNINGDRLSLVSFAGASFIETPLTLDYQIVSLTAENLATDLVPLKGSDLEAAVHAAMTVFGNKKEQSARAKILLLISDMEFDQQTQSLAFDLMKQEKIIPFGIAIGTAEGAPLSGPRGFRKDKAGKIIYSRSDIEPLKSIFIEAGGFLTRHTSGDQDLTIIYKNGIKKLAEQGELIEGESRIYNEYFQLLLLLGLILILITWFGFIPTRHLKTTNSLFVIFLTTIILLTQTVVAQNSGNLKDESDHFNRGRFQEALSEIDTLIANGEDSHKIRLQKGNILYRLNRFADAAAEFGNAYTKAVSSEEKAKALFNRGNALTQSGLLKDAIAHYEEAIKESPDDSESAKNLAYVKKLLNEESPKDKEEKQDNKENRDKEENKDKNAGDNGSSEPENNQDQNENESQDSPGENSEGNSNERQPTPSPQPDEGDTPSEKEEKPKESGSESDDKNSPDDETRQEASKAAGMPSPTGNQEKELRTEEMTYDQVESQLDSLEESTTLRAKHRYQKALQQLENLPKKTSDMDW